MRQEIERRDRETTSAGSELKQLVVDIAIKRKKTRRSGMSNYLVVIYGC